MCYSHIGISCAPCGALLRVNSNTGWRVLNVGGNYNNGSNAGLFQFNANNTSSNANATIGSRHLACKQLLCTGSSTPLGENFATTGRALVRPASGIWNDPEGKQGELQSA